MKKIGIYLFIFVGLTITFLMFFLPKSKSPLDPKTYGYINPTSLSLAKGEIFNFSLLDQDGKYVELYRLKKFKYVTLIVVNPTKENAAHIKRLDNEITNKRDAATKYLFIYPGDEINRKEIIHFFVSHQISTPILLDTSKEISRKLGLKKFFEQMTIDTNEWKKSEANTQINSHSIVKENIQYDINHNLNFNNEVAPIIQSKCLGCHSVTGQFLPFFDSFDKLKNWNDMALETVLNGRMPPVGADAFFGDYQDNFELTPNEKRILIQWFEQKKPKQLIESDPLKISIKRNPYNSLYPFIYETGMEHEAQIAPAGQMEYGYVQLGGPVPHDIWFAGVEVTSTNPRQLHHEAIMITSKPLQVYRDLGIKKFHITNNKLNRNQDGDIVLYTLRAMRLFEMKHSPGTYFRSQVWGAGKPQPFYFGNNNLAYIPKGYYIIMENHYMGTGKEDSEKTRIKFYGFKAKPKNHQRLHSYTLTTNDFTIPAFAENFIVETPTWEITEDIKFTNFLPHLHMRGSSVRLEAELKNGEYKTLYSAPNFNYGWQTGFIVNLKHPIAVKKGTKVKAVCTFDNSEYNPFNPDPTKKVKFGQRLDRTEMCKINTNFILSNSTSSGQAVFKPINKKINPQDFYEE